MTVPSRDKQIAAVSRYLDSEHTEGKLLNEVAQKIVDYFHKEMIQDLKAPSFSPHVGAAFRHPALSGAWFVAYETEVDFWLVSPSSRYGSSVPRDAPFWRWAEESRAGKGGPGSNEVWSVGDTVSRGQSTTVYTVVATGAKCVLLESGGNYSPEPNDNMEKYYRAIRTAKRSEGHGRDVVTPSRVVKIKEIKW